MQPIRDLGYAVEMAKREIVKPAPVRVESPHARILALRRGKAIPRTEAESCYMVALHSYIRFKRLSQKTAGAYAGYQAESFRKQMTALEERITNETSTKLLTAGVVNTTETGDGTDFLYGMG
jgi:hypothetical protein